ncbi:MAG: RsmE family RNA methyltransferase [Acidobacteriota bacterium]
MVHRFYAPGMSAGATRVVLDGVESVHLARVLRLRPGSRVRAFDGRGTEREARVATAHPKGAELDLFDPVGAAPEARVHVELGLGLLKADRFDAALRDAVMLGVAAVHPLLTERSDVPAGAVASGTRRERWHRIAVASSKQSGRATVPAVHEPAGLRACLAADRSPTRILLAEPSVAGAEPLQADAGWAAVTQALVLVGPEGGWTPGEVGLARAGGCRVMSLGTRTLRADAAPLVALSVLQFLWGDL